MGRWLVCASAVIAMAATPACSAVAHNRLSQSAVVMAPLIEPGGSVVLARAHPSGPEAGEVTRQPPATSWGSATAATLWPSGGRHPVWRGCQHVYNADVSSYLFGGG